MTIHASEPPGTDPSTEDPNRWVTASKLCARKRYELCPVRDNAVCDYLGLIPTGKGEHGDYRIDWQVYRARREQLSDRASAPTPSTRPRACES